MTKIYGMALMTAAFVLAPHMAQAHHSTAAYFDVNSEITVEGVVDEFVFKAPHAVLKFIVTNENGEDELWRAETLPAALLFRNGWRFNMFEKGETVTVTGNPSKDPDRHAVEVGVIVKEDGSAHTPFGP